MRKNILIIATLLCLIGFATACENKITNANDYVKKDDNNLQGEENSLVGTKWKLTAFVDVENDTRREPDYAPDVANAVNIAIDSMYLLSFDCDSLLSGKSFSNWLDGNYSADYNTNTLSTSIVGTKVGEAGDGDLYWNILVGEFKYFPFKLYPQALHLFYNDSKSYLEFNRIGGSDDY